MLATRMRDISEGICHAHGAECMFEYTHEFAPTVNSPEYVDVAVAAARNITGADNVDVSVLPVMISEDFGSFLQAVPGNFIFIGNGDTGKEGGIPLHNPTYDFSDEILLTGAWHLAEIARLTLPSG